MPIDSYDLNKLDPNTFEHLVNALAMRVLGPGHTGFGPGPDGGRDGFFEGIAPYPSKARNWSGVWYIQSKFHTPHLTTNAHKWLVEQIGMELASFDDDESGRVWPDNWIVATNIDPSGAVRTGSFDKARALVKSSRAALAKRFHIWGGRKLLELLAEHSDIADRYGEFVTSGRVLSEVLRKTEDQAASASKITRNLIVTQFGEQQYTKLEQAGSTTDNRPGIQKLFADVPYLCATNETRGLAAATLAHALAQVQRPSQAATGDSKFWAAWQRDPSRARVWFIKGGPGQGKSTLTQYLCQIQRAALILANNSLLVLPPQIEQANDVRNFAEPAALWPLAPRIPVVVELKEYASWLARKAADTSDRVVAYIADRLALQLGEEVRVGTLKRCFGGGRWLIVFDGLDEVPGDTKDRIADEVNYFINEELVAVDSDAQIVCTSRPQGYSGQFAPLDAASIILVSLSPEQALACARPLLILDRPASEGQAYFETLEEAVKAPAIAEIMTSPLQAHIMAVIVRDGGKPPERKWQLFDNFYEVIKKREANRNLPNRRLATLLREGDKLLRALHSRLGFELHARAETSDGALTSIDRDTFAEIVHEVVAQHQDENIVETAAVLVEAATERLVLVNTPESGESVRFDIRPLQEFFAAEHVYQSGGLDVFADRLRIICGDSHWREVMHFLISALVEQGRKVELASAIEVLIELDSHGDNDIREVCRRLSRGGVIASRLVQEGVLEQDKRVREQFRGAISSLVSCIDAAQFLTGVTAVHSRRWLVDILMAALREQAEPETVGAIQSLGKLIEDGDLRSSKVRDAVLRGSDAFVALFFNSVDNDFPFGDEQPRVWVAEIAVAILRRDDWFRGREVMPAVVRALAASRRVIEANGEALGLDQEMHSFVMALATYDERFGVPDGGNRRFGLLEARYYRRPQQLDWRSWTSKRLDSLRGAGGVFRTMFWLCKVAREPTLANRAELEGCLGGHLEHLQNLPRGLREFVDIDWLKAIPNQGRVEDSKMSLSKVIRTYTLHTPSVDDNVDWSGAIREIPWAVLDRLSRHDVDTIQALGDPGLLELFIRSILDDQRRPALLSSNVPIWGVIFDIEGIGPRLRDAAMQSSAAAVSALQHGRPVNAFGINLPEEQALLPHVAGAVVASALEFGRFAGQFNQKLTPKQAVSKTVKEYVRDARMLRTIFRKTSVDGRIRAAAFVLYHLHPSVVAKDNSPDASLIEELFDPNDARWYAPGIGLILSDAIVDSRDGARRAMGALLERLRQDYSSRQIMSPLLQRWREAAVAPVLKAHEPSLWA